MIVDRRALLGGSAALAAAPLTVRQAPPDPTEIWTLWPDGPHGGTPSGLSPEITERSTDPAYHDRIARWTTEPLVTVMRPERPNGASLLLIPGGGYRWAVVDKEGMDCARVFAAAGVTCFVLRYRLPGDGWAAGPQAPLQDAQRAMRMIRARAAGMGLDPARIAVLGASAGGHLAGWLTAHRGATYPTTGPEDEASARPDLTILLYPVATMRDPFAHAGSRRELLGEAPDEAAIAAHSLAEMNWQGATPVWLVHAMDDASVPVENSLGLMERLRADKVICEAHLFQEGGHGFGVRLIQGRPAAAWPELAMAFGRRNGWLG